MGKEIGMPQKLSQEDEECFPSLVTMGYRVSSKKDCSHNCVAYAAGDVTKSWDPTMIPIPGYYWPPNARRDRHPDALKSAFEEIGYEMCTGHDYEEGFEKVALYVDNNGYWSHAAKQEENGEWSCKLGREEDIRYKNPHCFGDSYGHIAYFMRRRKKEIADERPKSKEGAETSPNETPKPTTPHTA